jgi:hypothetical protein
MVVKRNPSEQGMGLVMALMTLLLLSSLGAALLTATMVDIWIGDNYRTASQLLYLTESGIEDGRETLGRQTIAPSATPFISGRPLLDATGREVGRYSVGLARANPLTLQSVGVIGTARKTVEVRLEKSGFPVPAAPITSSEGGLNDGVDPRLKTPAGAERFVDGVARNATDTFNAAWDEVIVLSAVGSPADYRVVVVNGDCELNGSSGFGVLLVRGNLTVRGNFSWSGLIVVVGQGTLRAAGPTTGWVTGAVFLSRTRDIDRTHTNPLGTVLPQLGSALFDLSGNPVSIVWSAIEVDRANARFAYIPRSYREF